MNYATEFDERQSFFGSTMCSYGAHKWDEVPTWRSRIAAFLPYFLASRLAPYRHLKCRRCPQERIEDI